jgi:hypothetical protein
MRRFTKMKVYKLMGENYEIRDTEVVYLKREDALDALREWEGFFAAPIEEVINEGLVWIEEWDLQ